MVELVEKQSDNAADVESPSKADEQKVEEVAADASNENVDASEAKIDETVGEKVDEPIDENIEKSDDKEESKDENAGGESKAEGETAEADKPDEKEGEQDEKKAEKDEKGDELDEKMDDIELSEQPESFSPEHPDDSRVHEVDIQDDEVDYDEDDADYGDDDQSEDGEQGDTIDDEAKDKVELKEGEKLEEIKEEEVDAVDKHEQEANVAPKTDCKQFVYVENVPPMVTMPYLRHVLKHDEHMEQDIIGWKDLDNFCIWIEAEEDEFAQTLAKKLDGRRFARCADKSYRDRPRDLQICKTKIASHYVREEIEEERKKKNEQGKQITARDFERVYVPSKTRYERDMKDEDLKKIQGVDRWDPEWQGAQMMGKGKAKIYSKYMKRDSGRELQPKIDGGVEIFAAKAGGFRAIGRFEQEVLLAPSRKDYWMAVDDKDLWCEQMAKSGSDGFKETHAKLLVKYCPRPTYDKGRRWKIVDRDGKVVRRNRTRGGRRVREQRERREQRLRERGSGRFDRERRGGRGGKGGKGKGKGGRYEDRRAPPLRRGNSGRSPARRSFDYRRSDDRDGKSYGDRRSSYASNSARNSYGDRNSYADRNSYGDRGDRNSYSGAGRNSYASNSGRDTRGGYAGRKPTTSSIKYYGSNRPDETENARENRSNRSSGPVAVLKNVDSHQEKSQRDERKRREERKSKGGSDDKRSSRAEKKTEKSERSSKKEKESRSSKKESSSRKEKEESRSAKKRSREDASDDKDRKSRRSGAAASDKKRKRESSPSFERSAKPGGRVKCAY